MPKVGPDGGKLAAFIERIERLEEERKELGADVREIFAEAKGEGFDTKIMRQIIRLRKMTPADRAEAEFLRDSYKKLLGIED
ncbi:MAG: DUF2312 domain-containing protein [Alphaproteobacteria bacterium]|nr:DUF2312 domain-containing protein [Alphaproteobacteria bacterium]MBR5130568.1 DUF2312 domain-containing protein [Alphaproteobacteria bacterium]